MAGIGRNGSVTTYPKLGEKLCVGCEFWEGYRTVVQFGTAAQSSNGSAATCSMIGRDLFPQQPCLNSCFRKWSKLK